MPDDPGPPSLRAMNHPFADHIALAVVEQAQGHSRCELEVAPQHLNPHGVVHGAVLFALADTGMGAAVYSTLRPGESCTTIEIKISFLRAVREGTLVCETVVVNRGRTVAHLESKVYAGDALVASASGSFALLPRRAQT